MGKRLNGVTAVLGTLGLIVCFPLDASLPGHSAILSAPSESIALQDALLVDADPAPPSAIGSNGERLTAKQENVFTASSSPSALRLSTRVPVANEVAAQGQREPILGSNTEDVLYSQGLEASAALDRNRLRRIMQRAIAQSLHRRSMGEIVQTIAQQLLGSPYQTNLLDQTSQETLVVSLSQFDCVLFVETVLALARGVAVQDYSYQTFANYLQDQRYRDGKLDGYCSRLHYFSEWIADNQKRGKVFNLTPELSRVALHKSLNFMSRHRQSYPRLMSDPVAYQCVRQMEANFQALTLNYIPTDQVHTVYTYLQPGDIVAIATSIPGLDVTHTGLVYRNANGGIGLIHAAPTRGVKISPDLATYVSQVKEAIGVLIIRSTDPRLS